MLHRLDNAALRPGRGPQARAQPVQSLMVIAVYRKYPAVPAVQQTVLLRADQVDCVAPLPPVKGADPVGQVLDQSPAQKDVQDLDPRQMPRMGLPAAQ